MKLGQSVFFWPEATDIYYNGDKPLAAIVTAIVGDTAGGPDLVNLAVFSADGQHFGVRCVPVGYKPGECCCTEVDDVVVAGEPDPLVPPGPPDFVDTQPADEPAPRTRKK